MRRLRIERAGPRATVWLDRPDVHNAFDPVMIAELDEAFATLGAVPDVRVIVLAGTGRSFSAGADLEWMRSIADQGDAENVADAHRLAAMLERIRDCPKPVVARVHGAAMGGGCGLVAASDIAIAESETRFAFSEARLGIVPAVISPFVVPRIGVAAARELFLTGERFDASRAEGIGLVARVVSAADLDAAVEDRVAALMVAGPEAQAAIKALLRRLSLGPDESDVRDLTARLIAERRGSAEGRDGMAAFLERREPGWRAGSHGAVDGSNAPGTTDRSAGSAVGDGR